MLAFITLFSMLSGESTVQFELLKYYSKPTVIIAMYTGLAVSAKERLLPWQKPVLAVQAETCFCRFCHFYLAETVHIKILLVNASYLSRQASDN